MARKKIQRRGRKRPERTSAKAEEPKDSNGPAAEGSKNEVATAESSANTPIENSVGKDETSLIEKDTPALLEILDTYQEKIALVEKQLNGGLQNAVNEAKEEQIDLNNGISLLEVKYQVMLAYCIRIAFYLMNKLTGKSVAKSKLIEQQAHLRVLLEKLRPIDKKIKYQVSQLLRTAAMDATGEEKREKDGADPLAFGPSPGKLVKKDGGEEDETPADVYRPPQVTPMEVQDKNDKKKAKRTRKMRERASNNAVLKNLKEMVSEAPAEISMGGETRERNKTEKDRERFEEENFVRLQETKKDRALRKRKEQDKEAVDAVGDLDDFVDIMKAADASKAEEKEGKEELAALRREKALKAMESGGRKRKVEDTESGSSAKRKNRHMKKKKKKTRR